MSKKPSSAFLTEKWAGMKSIRKVFFSESGTSPGKHLFLSKEVYEAAAKEANRREEEHMAGEVWRTFLSPANGG